MRVFHTSQHFFTILSYSTRLHFIITSFSAFFIIFVCVFCSVWFFSAFCCHSAAIMAANHSIESCVYFSLIVNCRRRSRRGLPLPLRVFHFPLNGIVTVVIVIVRVNATALAADQHLSALQFILVQRHSA